ncbi:MAG TPA: hypothetical protein VK949_09105 [Methylotenera sp.]|nr:hypothetical protein [Methylotenera sp.]
MTNIIDILDLSDSRSRSVSLERDIYNGNTVEGYLPTTNSLSALKRIIETLGNGGAQRAWRLVGPYGSGKSAFGLWLSQLLAGKNFYPKAAEILINAKRDIAVDVAESNRFGLAVVGSRCSFGYALATSILKAIEHHGFKSDFGNDIDFIQKTYKSSPLNSVCDSMLTDFLHTTIANGYAGLTLIIDEVGKFVEYAALYPHEADLIPLQQISEVACKQDDDRIVVIALLHQHFASYAAGVGKVLNDEWQKISSRFEEVPFDEPIDQYVNFASHALNSNLNEYEHISIIDKSKSNIKKAIDLRLFEQNKGNGADLISFASSLYPLHPATIFAAAIASKRYGQSERSFHAFIFGNEDFGMKKFASANSIGSWYTLVNLYDYFTAGVSLKFRELSAERKWSHSVHLISTSGLNEDSVNVLKAIAILELTNAQKLSIELISFAIDHDIEKTTSTLKQLVDKGLLLQRRDFQEFSIANPDAVNIEALYETVAKNDTNNLMLEGINELLAQHKVVANKHYINTGTFRTLGVVAGTLTAWPTTESYKNTSDGWLKIILVDAQEKTLALATQKIKKDTANAFEISLIIETNPETKAALMEYSIWRRVLDTLGKTQLDPWSTRYAEGRANDAGILVEDLIINTLASNDADQDLIFWYKGKPIEKIPGVNLSKLASWLFDTTYPNSPKIINELINKNKLSPAIVQARQRLMESFLKANVQEALFKEDEFPPEKLMHHTLFEETKLWSKGTGRWYLKNATKENNKNFFKLWEAISISLQSDKAISFAELIDQLSLPPFGIRSGPASMWLASYLLINKDKCAIFERGTLLLELTPEHLQRIFKNPNIFTIREIESGKSSEDLMHDYRHALTTVGCTFNDTVTYLDLARALILWFSKLPEYSKKTQGVSGDTRVLREMIIRSQDPIDLLISTIPTIHLDTKSTHDFRAWLTECLGSLGMSLRKLQDEAVNALSSSFKIPGSLSQLRNQLQSECIKEASTISDVKLKAFVHRCMDVVLTDEKWLDAIASLVVLRPLDTWNDETLQSFSNGVYELSRQYNHWMYVILQKGKAPISANRFMAVTLTQAGGEERSVLVTIDSESTNLSKELLGVISRSSINNPKVLAAAITQALMELKLDSEQVDSKEEKLG